MEFVLVHSDWSWDRVAATLRALGHRVLAPVPQGSDPAAIGAGLVDAIRREGLRELTLVAHRDGKPAIQYVADHLPEITQRVVFVGSWELHDGDTVHAT
jgi:hypothetical protein